MQEIMVTDLYVKKLEHDLTNYHLLYVFLFVEMAEYHNP